MTITLPRLRLPTFSGRELRFFKILAADARRSISAAPHKPSPDEWSDDRVTAAWIGHSTVLINFCGVNILTDPVLGSRVGIQIAGPMVLGMKRYVAPALKFDDLPRIDLILLSHAHMDHFDMRTLRNFPRGPRVVSAAWTADLLRCTRLGKSVVELGWGEKTTLEFERGGLEVEAFEVRHWGARLRTDDHRGYNGYILRRNGRAILIGGDTSFTPKFRELRGRGGTVNGGTFDLAIMPIGAYDPWINSHCTPEQAVAMADMAGAKYVLPVHHRTFKLSAEAFDEPIRRFEAALAGEPERVALREVGETFQLPK